MLKTSYFTHWRTCELLQHVQNVTDEWQCTVGQMWPLMHDSREMPRRSHCSCRTGLVGRYCMHHLIQTCPNICFECSLKLCWQNMWQQQLGNTGRMELAHQDNVLKQYRVYSTLFFFFFKVTSHHVPFIKCNTIFVRHDWHMLRQYQILVGYLRKVSRYWRKTLAKISGNVKE